jgi:hypothetical protein
MSGRSASLALGLALVLQTWAGAHADPWPPIDPDQETTDVVFTSAWAMQHRDARSLIQLQDVAGAKGKIVEYLLKADPPRVVFRWNSVAPDGSKSQLKATVFASGDFGATVSPADGGEAIVLNSYGAFVCRQCTPPVSACGHRPSWIPRDLHWDNFDCRCTLTGPQSVQDAECSRGGSQ